MSLFGTDINEKLLTEIQLDEALRKINAKMAEEVSRYYASNDNFPKFEILIKESEDDDFEHEGYYNNAKDAIEALMGYI